ncbi:MAG: hypothetical protein QOJ75_583 [Chloroflexota bacterium]|jgi:hypothetical protein|nr:hypothetical protein [Chloroflexota bacterium]
MPASLPRVAVIGLMAFGALGLLFAAVLLFGLTRLGSGAERLAAQQQALIQLAESGRATAVDGRAASERARAGIAATADAADQAARFVQELGGALRETGSALRVDIFGTRPFATAADRVEAAAGQADLTASALGTAATNAHEGASALDSVSLDLDRAATTMTAVGQGLSGSSGAWFDQTSITLLSIALIGLIIWLAIPAALCLWLGVRLWRRRDRGGAGPAAGHPVL